MDEIEDELVVEVLIHVFPEISNKWNDFIQQRSDPYIRDDDDEKYDQSKNEEGKIIKWWTQWNLDMNYKNKGISLRDMIIKDFKTAYTNYLNTKGGKRRKTSRRTRKPRRKSSRRLRRKSRRQRKR